MAWLLRPQSKGWTWQAPKLPEKVNNAKAAVAVVVVAVVAVSAKKARFRQKAQKPPKTMSVPLRWKPVR